MESYSVELVVGVAITATGAISNNAYAVWSDQYSPIYGSPVITPVNGRTFLPLLIHGP
jgi:hypothetical protein